MRIIQVLSMPLGAGHKGQRKMKPSLRIGVVKALTLWAAVFNAYAQAPTEDETDRPMVTIDHFVPHISTVPANAGEYVKLFVRKRCEATRAKAAGRLS